MNKSIKSLVRITCMLFVSIFLLGPFSERSAEGQPMISPETNDGSQEQLEAEQEPEAEPNPEQMQPQQSTPGVKRMSLTLDYAHFTPLTNSPGNQVKLLLNYTVDDSTLIGKTINAVMEVYSTNQTLMRVSSFPEPIIAHQSGVVQLATTFADEKIQKIIAIAIFTGPGKLVSISDPVTIDLNLGQVIEK
ncbi:MAG: hypothetical protein ACRD47_15260 [Nitrososphaeraceae archaeon]